MFKLPHSIPVLYSCPTSKSKLTVAQVKIDGVITPMYRLSDVVNALGYSDPKSFMRDFIAKEIEIQEEELGGVNYPPQLSDGEEADIQAIPTTSVITEAQAAPVIEVANSGCKVTTLVKRGPNLALKFAWKGEGMAQRRQTIFINQPLLFKLVTRSNLPSARPFQDWLFGELLPAVTKDGYYIGQWARSRLEGIDTRKAFTSAIKVGIADGRFNDGDYSRFTMAINQAALGKPNAERDQLDQKDLEKVRELEYTAHGLLAVSESDEDFYSKLELYLKRNLRK